MELSANIIIDHIRPYNPHVYMKDPDFCFSSASIARKSEDCVDSALIYVCSFSDYLAMKNRNNRITVLIVKHPNDSFPEDCVPVNAITADFEDDAISFYTIVQGLFNSIFSWCSKMDSFLIRKRSIQEVLALSEQVIKNPIVISDSSFSLVAYTGGIPIDDPIAASLISKGYFDQSAIDKFNKLKLPDLWKDAVESYEMDAGGICTYPTINRVMHYYNNYYARIVMICSHTAPTEGLMDLFEMLVDHLIVCFETQWNNNYQMPHIHDSLIISMIGPNPPEGEAARTRAHHCGIPFQSNFRFFRVAPDDTNNLNLQRIEREISTYVPDAKITMHQQNLLVLTHQPSMIKDRFREVFGQLRRICDLFDARCGASDRFNTLSDIKRANEQTRTAIAIAKPKTALQFNDCYIKAIMTSDPETAVLSQSSEAYLKLKAIKSSDDEHDTNIFEMLKIYLQNERKATDTANLMHMHRNNIIYHMKKVCDQYDINLDDSRVRLRLMLAFECFE